MKKALALVLALVLALSMAVSAFAIEGLVELQPVPSQGTGKTVIPVVDAKEPGVVLYTAQKGVYYIALDPDFNYTDVKLTVTGNPGMLDAELVEFDPETMEVTGSLALTYTVYDADGNAVTEPVSYEEAKEWLAFFENRDEVTTYYFTCDQFVNIIKVTVGDNWTAHYLEGFLKIDAKLAGKDFTGTLHFVNDVAIFEYEEVKHASKYFADDWALEIGGKGYSDYDTYLYGGYDVEKYVPSELRYLEDAAVVATTAFRAIEGQNLCLVDFYEADEETSYRTDAQVVVTLKDIAAGQKGVNFKNYYEWIFEDVADTPENAARYIPVEKIVFGFYGDDIIKGEYQIDVALDCDLYELREWFGLKLEEEDRITYYVVDANNKKVDELYVDYMTDDLTKPVSFTVTGSNSALGEYAIVLEVPANEVAGESNPNTGAESVVGVVAALAVVSVATAAAVSLKK